MVPGPLTRGDARLPGHRIRSYPVLPTVRRCSVHGPARGRRPPTQGHHRGHHEVARDLGLREDRGVLRSAVRQDAHVAVLLRLYQQVPGASSF